MIDYDEKRRNMVRRQIAARGVKDPAVLEAMETVRREEFLPDNLKHFVDRDAPLPIGEGQTISQPYIVAYMTEALELEPDDRALEVGTGSGYAAAVLAEIAETVVTIERHESLANSARKTLKRLGYENVTVVCGDGTLGWPEAAPYDAIIVAAGGPKVPATLRDQLAIGGRLVIPVGQNRTTQKLIRVRRISEEDFRQETLTSVRFVPLVGEKGWET